MHYFMFHIALHTIITAKTSDIGLRAFIWLKYRSRFACLWVDVGIYQQYKDQQYKDQHRCPVNFSTMDFQPLGKAKPA
jgi:hypothetical protein